MKRVRFLLLLAALLYIAVTTTVYRFHHPELTETQLFLKIPHALAMPWSNP